MKTCPCCEGRKRLPSIDHSTEEIMGYKDCPTCRGGGQVPDDVEKKSLSQIYGEEINKVSDSGLPREKWRQHALEQTFARASSPDSVALEKARELLHRINKWCRMAKMMDISRMDVADEINRFLSHPNDGGEIVWDAIPIGCGKCRAWYGVCVECDCEPKPESEVMPNETIPVMRQHVPEGQVVIAPETVPAATGCEELAKDLHPSSK